MNQSLPRRVFLITLAASGAALTTTAQAQALLDEKDAQAVALGYVADAKRVDVKKFPKFVAGQNCTNCALYQGKGADRLAAARCLVPSKWRAPAGAAPGRKKHERLGWPLGCAVTARTTGFRGNKAALPSKPCVVCGLPMSWRRRWAKNWAEVKYCSDACRNKKVAHA